jgi:hypothetical protein
MLTVSSTHVSSLAATLVWDLTAQKKKPLPKSTRKSSHVTRMKYVDSTTSHCPTNHWFTCPTSRQDCSLANHLLRTTAISTTLINYQTKTAHNARDEEKTLSQCSIFRTPHREYMGWNRLFCPSAVEFFIKKYKLLDEKLFDEIVRVQYRFS